MDFDEFDDDDLNGEDLLDALEETERVYPSPCRPRLMNHQALSSIPATTQSTRSDYGSAPDFSDPEIIIALEKADEDFVKQEPNDAIITLTKAQLDLIKRNAYLAGWQGPSSQSKTFSFLSLPAELRLMFYGHYFSDHNTSTAGKRAQALPDRLSNAAHCCKDNTWCKTDRPHISTALLQTCRQIYEEARDDFFYKDRHFKASIGRLDAQFKDLRPHLRFWQYMQHVDLEITSAVNRGARYEAGNLIEQLVAMLRGGQNLRSFKLKYGASQRQESITRFKGLTVSGPVSITQIFKDWFEPEVLEEAKRRVRLEQLLFSMLQCSAHNAPAYEFMSSTAEVVQGVINLDFDAPSFETHITISSGFD